MRKFITILVVALTTAFGAVGAEAQVRIKPAINPNIMVPKAPRVKPVQPKIQPKIIIIPPSAAIRQALKQAPGGKALSVKLVGQTYIVKVKQGGTIKQLSVNSAPGAASPLP